MSDGFRLILSAKIDLTFPVGARAEPENRRLGMHTWPADRYHFQCTLGDSSSRKRARPGSEWQIARALRQLRRFAALKERDRSIASALREDLASKRARHDPGAKLRRAGRFASRMLLGRADGGCEDGRLLGPPPSCARRKTAGGCSKDLPKAIEEGDGEGN